MKFRTEIEIAPFQTRIGYDNRTLALGSCFAAHIASRLAEARFRVAANPTGILFNPLSIAAAIGDAHRQVTLEELHTDGGRWFHFGFHGDLAAPTPEEALLKMNAARAALREALRTSDRAILTFGTAWVYERNGAVVANCHRCPAAEFRRRRLSVGEVADAVSTLLEGPLAGKGVLLTVSPVRHLGDGLTGNAASKATLRVAIEELLARRSTSPPSRSSPTTCATTASMPTTWCTPPGRPSTTSGSGSPARCSPMRPAACCRRSRPSWRPPPTVPAIHGAPPTAPSASASWSGSRRCPKSIFNPKRHISEDVSK